MSFLEHFQPHIFLNFEPNTLSSAQSSHKRGKFLRLGFTAAVLISWIFDSALLSAQKGFDLFS